MDELLLLLFKHGASKQFIRLSTSKIAKALSMSQQNASRRLIELEKQGKIERNGSNVRLNPSAVKEIASVYGELKKQFDFDSVQQIKIEGKIVSGLREGAYYLSLPGYKKALQSALGYAPYPGTLNLRLDKANIQKRFLLKEGEAIFIAGFKSGNRTFGAAYAYPCKIGGITGAILIPVRTHHGPDILEIIAPVSITKTLHKKEGDWVRIII